MDCGGNNGVIGTPRPCWCYVVTMLSVDIMQVPLHYKLMSYQAVSAWEAFNSYIPMTLARPLRTGVPVTKHHTRLFIIYQLCICPLICLKISPCFRTSWYPTELIFPWQRTPQQESSMMNKTKMQKQRMIPVSLSAPLKICSALFQQTHWESL